MQCSPSFAWNWGKQNDPTACWHQLHPRFRVLQQGKCLSYPPDLKFPRTRYLGQRAAEKPSTFLPIFMGFVPDTNYKHLECFIMLGTLSELRRGQMFTYM